MTIIGNMATYGSLLVNILHTHTPFSLLVWTNAIFPTNTGLAYIAVFISCR